MKKLIFLFAMVFAVSMAMAQHLDVVNQTGDNNGATVDQGFIPGEAVAEGNVAFVDQIGDRNTADVDQLDGGFAGDGHWAKIYSEGDDNTGIINQYRAAGDANIYQYGNKNWADIFQRGNFGTGAPLNPAFDAFASQIGDENVITIDVWGTNSTAYAEQVGDKNNIDQDLGSADGEKVENSNFQARQFGDRNTATQLMDGEGFETNVSPLAVDNFGNIYQDGDDNTAIQTMKEDIPGLGAAISNWADAYQFGNKNWSEQHQVGFNNTSTHSQIGDENVEITNQN